jgi:hypothetical protein
MGISVGVERPMVLGHKAQTPGCTPCKQAKDGLARGFPRCSMEDASGVYFPTVFWGQLPISFRSERKQKREAKEPENKYSDLGG